MAFRNYILLFALVAGTIAGPINVLDGDSKCATKCEASLSDSGKFQYTPGTTYKYTYEGSTETKLQGTSDQTTSLKIDANAEIEVLSKCEFALKLSGVTLTENGQSSSSSSEFKQKLEDKPLRFAFQDGVIENVCSMQGEDERVLNIKRGVLSTFQNTMKDLSKEGLFTETDIAGTCPTTYTSETSTFGGTFTIKKSKDILACTDRTGNVSSIHSKRYNVPSKMQNAPLLKSTHECVQTVSKHQISAATCTEVLVFRPFSKDGSGAITTAKQVLRFSSKSSSTSVRQSSVQRRSSLLFHHLYDESVDMNAKSDVIALLQEICTEVADDIKKSAPELFGALISKMKRLDSDKMMQVYNSVNGGRICSSLRGKQFFYDAVPMVATEASLALTKKLITDNIVQGVEAEAWLTQLAFIPRPSYGMLSVIMPLLNNEAYKTKALLGISAMVHKICDNHANCKSNAHVADFINILTANIGSTCSSSTKTQRELIMVTLKAFGNAGDAVTSSSVIGRCITNSDIDTEVRVVALQAYRRMPCSISREDAMRIYQNFEHDSELRIHAFLAVMSCPTTSVLSKVRMVLSGEPVNQVGSFVWTYLENLKETSSPLRQELSTILDDAKLRQDFNLDARKFSRNMERSFFSDYLNAGAQIESNLIWSQRSYIPRSAMLNVTVDMFGNSINLVEFGGRVQGLEKIVEKFFGPNGYFSQKETKELMDNKRQMANYISSFDKVFKTPKDKITTSMYVKLFGNELMFDELDSDDWTELQGFNVIDFLLKLAQPKKIDLTKNVQFLDSSLIVPTCVGLPMNLTVNGTASVSLDINGNVDLRNIAASPRSFDISGHIKPSAAVMISGMMGVDAIVTKSSMKMVSSMHSSTQLDGTMTLKDGQIFNVQLNTPKEKMEVFHVETEFYMNGKEMTTPEPSKVYKKCTPAGMTKIIGMEVCVDVTLPTFHKTGLPLPPFTGPMNAQVFIEKKDTHTGYSFTAKYENTPATVSGTTYQKRVMHVSLDTPGSKVDRKLLIESEFDPAMMTASAKMMSPWKKLEWSTSFKNTVALKKALTSLKVDDTKTYSADAQLAIEEKSLKTVWTPSLTITIPDKPTMSVSGSVEMGSGKTIGAVELSVKNFSRKPITLTSSLTQAAGGKSYDFAFNLKSDLLTTKVDSSLGVSPGSYTGRGTIEYSVQSRPLHRFTLSGKFADESIGDLRKYSMQTGVVSTEFTNLQFNLNSDLSLTANHVDTNVEITLNKEKLSLSHKTTKQGTWEDLTVESSSSFKYPTKSIDFSGQMSHKHNANVLRSSAQGTYAGQTVKASVDLDRSMTDRYTGETAFSYPGRDISFNVDVQKTLDGEQKIIANGKWGADDNSKVTINTSWKAGETHSITSDVKIPGYPFVVTFLVKPNLMDFMGKTKLIYDGKTYALDSEYKLEATKITSSGAWSCPSRQMSYSIDMRNSNGMMTAETEFSWMPSKKVSMVVEYNNRDSSVMYSRNGKVTMTTPFGTQSFSSEFELKPTDKYIKMNNELIMDGERSTFNGRYSYGTGEVSLDSPLIRFGEIKFINVVLTHTMSSASTTLKWTPTKQISGEAKWLDSDYSVTLVTPFQMSKMGASMKHAGTTSATVEGYWNEQKVTLTMSRVGLTSASIEADWNAKKATLTMSRTGFEKFDFTATYPGRTISGKFSQSGDISLFTTEAELLIDAAKYYAKIGFKGDGPITLTLDATTPLAVKKISGNLIHKGSWMNFENQASLTWDNNRVRTTVSFNGAKANVDIKTPWMSGNAMYEVIGTKESFSSTGLIKWAEDKQIEGTLKFDMTNGITMSFDVNSPFYSTISGSFEHSGPVNNFNNKATITYAPSKTFVVFSEFNQGKISGKVGVKGIPHETYQSGELMFEMTATDFTSKLTWNDVKSMTARASYPANGRSLTASLTTPFDISAEMTHSQTETTMNNQATFQWSDSKKITSNIDISTNLGVEAKVNVDTPWRRITFTSKQQGKPEDFIVSSTFSWQTGKEMTSKLEFSNLNKMKLVWSLTTPWEQMKTTGFTLSHQGTSMDFFTNEMEVKCNDKKASLGTTWDMRTGAKLTVFSTNPWKTFTSTLQYSGKPMDFTTSADFTMDGQTYSTKSTFKYADTIALTMDLNTVVYKPVSFATTLSKEESSITMTWGTNEKISASATYSMDVNRNSLDAEVDFTTSFEGYESGKALISHTGSLMNFRNTAEVSFRSYQGKLVSSFSTTGDITGNMDLTSSWYNASGSFSHQGTWKQFNNNAKLTYSGKTITASSMWKMVNGIEAEMKLNAPFKTIDAKLSHQVSLSKEITSTAGFTMDGKQMFSTDLTFLNAPGNVRLDFTFTSPVKSFTTKYTHTGTMKTRCNAEFEITWDSTNKMSADWSISLINGLTTTVEIRSPWQNLSGEIKHIGTMKSFDNTVSLTYGVGKTMKLETTFKMSPDFLVESTFTSPLKNANILYRHSGTMDNFACHLEGAYDAMPLTADLKWDMASAYEASLDVKSPWKNFKTSFESNTDLTNLLSKAHMECEHKTFDAALTFKTATGYMGDLTIKTPWRDMSANFDVKGQITNFDTTATVSWEAGKSITAEANYSARSGSVKVTTPWKVVATTFRCAGPMENFTSKMELTWDTVNRIVLEAKADSRTGMDTEWKLTTPWKVLSAKLKYDMNFNINAETSWATDKTVSVVVTNSMSENSMETSMKINSPWKNLSADYRRDGVWTKFDATTKFTCDSQEITMTNTFDMESMDASTKITTPWRDMSFNVVQSGDLTRFTGDYEISWETGKKISTSVFFDRNHGWDSKVTVNTPWRTLSSNAKFTGELTDFTSSLDFSWETGKTMSTTAAFSLNPVVATWTYNCADCSLSAEIKHNGSLMDFTNSASFSWQPTKKIEMSSTFKFAEEIKGSATFKSPFSKDFNLSFSHTATTGELTITNPFTEKLEVTYRYTDMYNFNSKFTYGTQVVSADATTTWNNGVQTNIKMTLPTSVFAVEVDHQGDYYTFTNTMEAKWNQKVWKLTTNADLPKWTLSQTLETPITGFETMSWSGSMSLTETTAFAKLELAKNTDKLAFEFDGNVEWKKYQSVFTYALKVNTPFAGFEENKLSEVLKLSQRLFQLTSTGYYGSAANSKTVEIYFKNTGTQTMTGMESYIKATIDGELSEVSFDFSLDSGVLSVAYNSDLKFYPSLTSSINLNVNHSRTQAGLNHTGTLVIKNQNGEYKWTYNAGSNSNMCETGLTVTHNTVDLVTYSHKTTWTTDYKKMDHQMNFKNSKCEMFKDCEFKFSYDFTKPTMTMGMTLFNDPTKPFDFKSEVMMGDNMSVMVEVATPFEHYKTAKTTFTLNMAQQPFTVTLQGELNGQSVLFTTGSFRFEAPAMFNIETSFKSQIPNFEKLSFNIKNSKLQDQWKPHMLVQYGGDKTIEVSGTFSWVNQYKATMDINTPFDFLRSVTADITIDNKLPQKLSSSMSFKTGKMAEKISAEMNFDMEAMSFDVTMSTPFESMKTFEVTASVKPRLSMLVKLNGQTLFNLNGNAQFTSWTSHSVDVSMTYPFFNKFMRIQVVNDLEMGSDKSLKSHVDFEYIKDKEIGFKFDFKSAESSTLSFLLETPFEKFEKTSYAVTYSGNPKDWTETTQTEFYFGKVNTRTTFSMNNGITVHSTVTGEMKNGASSFNEQLDLVLTGGLEKFDIQTSMSGTYLPAMKYETSWQYSPRVLSLKTSLNKYNLEYVHNGLWNDFSCNWKVAVPTTSETKEWNGNWSFKKADGLAFTSRITGPSQRHTLNWSATSLKGSFNLDSTYYGETIKYTASYQRTATPFKYEGTFNVESQGHRLATSVLLTENIFEFPISYDNKEVFAIRAKNPLNADSEYKPTIELVLGEGKYEFDGLFKNEGQGLVRDFKLHMMGPRGMDSSFTFKFEFRTQSNQLVPGDMKLYLSHTPKGQNENKAIDMTASWGNDHATIVFVEPQPMKYSMDFTVSTTGQSATFVANWDTNALDKSAKLELTNKFEKSSRKMVSDMKVNVIYTGIARGFTSELDWTDDKFEHKFTLDYNGKNIGYAVKCDRTAGSSLELISQWRSVMLSWNNIKSGSSTELQLGFYWDSQKDTSKRFLGTSKWELTGANMYKWTTTFSHPALMQPITITDNIEFNTAKYYLDFKKTISYSADTTKDIVCDMNLQKDLKWGVSLKQDFNKVDVHMGTEFSQLGSISSFKYKSADGLLKNFMFKTNYNPSTRSFSVELVTPMKTFKIASMSTSNTCTVTVTIDRAFYTTKLVVRPEEYYMLVNFSGVKTDMKFEAKKLVGGYQVELSKIEGSKTTVEGLAAISMNESRTLNGKLYWNPTLVSEIKDQIAAIRSSLKSTIKTMQTAATTEVTKKMNRMQLGSDFNQVMPHVQRETDLLTQDINAAKIMIARGYNQDIFFIKSMDEATNAWFTSLAVKFTAMQTKITNFYNDVIVPRFSHMMELRSQAMLNIVNKLQQYQTTMTTKWIEHTKLIREELVAFADDMQTYIDMVTEFMAAHPVVKTLKDFHTSVMVKFNGYTDGVFNKVIVVANPQMYSDAIFKIHNYVKDMITNSKLANLVDLSSVTGLWDTIMYKAKFYLNYYDVTGNTKIMLTHAKNVASEYMDEYLTHYIDQTIDGFTWVTFDVPAGRIEFQFDVPTALNKFDMDSIRSRVMMAFGKFMSYIYNLEFSMEDMIYSYLPFPHTQILPPFPAQGIIAGQHIRTWDRRHYDFSSGKCSYLLARDFHDGNFTVFVNYNGAEQSLTVHSNGKVIDIAQDNTVKMDNNKIELPVWFFNTSISRLGHLVVLKNTLGVKVICDNVHGLCTVEMSGHYFAKTGGLFGTYNYEPLDDFTSSTNKNNTDVTTFANSWTARCTGTNTAKKFPQIPNTKEYKACAALFKEESSPLSSCFKTVNPENAFHKCITDMSKDVTSTTANGPCKASVFYKVECRFAGVELPMPSQCVTCDVSTSTIQQGSSMKITRPVMAADIVFVVEEKMCNYDIEDKLPTLAKLIESSLSRNSYSDIRFGLVGFGGENVHSPSHVHTMDSKMFAARSEFGMGTKNLKFSTAGENKDVMDAIDFAAQYPFRAGASKVIITLPCSDCSESKHSYSAILERLSSENITLHVVNEFSYDFIVSGQNPSSNYVFGIDNAAFYSVRDVGRLNGDKRRYSRITKPVDRCSKMALETSGTVFDLSMMTKMRSKTIKNFQTVFANRLALTTTPSRCTVCSCEYNTLFMMSRSVCKKC